MHLNNNCKIAHGAIQQIPHNNHHGKIQSERLKDNKHNIDNKSPSTIVKSRHGAIQRIPHNNLHDAIQSEKFKDNTNNKDNKSPSIIVKSRHGAIQRISHNDCTGAIHCVSPQKRRRHRNLKLRNVQAQFIASQNARHLPTS